MNSPDYEARYRLAAGNVFARLRNERNWSLREFAEHVGDVAHTSLYAIERGETTPSINILGRVGACFGMDLISMLLLIADNLDPEPSELGELLWQFRSLPGDQQAETRVFIEFLKYRDSC